MKVTARGTTDPSRPVEQLPFVGGAYRSRLAKLGITTVGDLLWHLPSRYEDFTNLVNIGSIEPQQEVSIQGAVARIQTKRIFPRRMTVTDALIQDESGAIKAIWFNQPYLERNLPVGCTVSLAGKVVRDKRGTYLSNPVYEKLPGDVHQLERDLKHTGRLVPVYPETSGITSKYLRFLIKPILDQLSIEDYLPIAIRNECGFPDLASALREVHYPSDASRAKRARQRLAFDELLLLQLKALIERRKLNQLRSTPLPFEASFAKKAVGLFPFTLTTDQRVAAWEIFQDLERAYPMNRLLEGDVGSGKTAVAVLAGLMAVRHNQQAVFLAPTEVLAQQHYHNILSLVRDQGARLALLTNTRAFLNDKKLSKAALKSKIAKGEADIIIGTHAVIQKDVNFKQLAMVIIDEQHRFGIEQRAALVRRSGIRRDAPIPHLLSMTATPIPRTLALTIFGDLDISLLKEKPKNRQPTVTRIISPSRRHEAYEFIRNQVARGRQVFVICPRIEAAEEYQPVQTSRGSRQLRMNLLWAEVKAVEEEFARLSRDVFPDLRVAMLHGRMKSREKEQVMRAFRERHSDILVATSVIEVGIDIPNATVMAVESAERFGLAQLHQFRGRVGRDVHQSYCLLFTSSADQAINARLKALVSSDDGFALAEQDLKLRGPGEFFGVKQSGIPDLAMASLADLELVKKARFYARTLLKKDPGLKQSPLLANRLDKLREMTHFE